MSVASLVQIVTMGAAILSACIALAAFVRVGRWRDSDDGRTIREAIHQLQNHTASDDGGPSIKADIHKIKNEITKVDIRLGIAERASDKVNAVDGRITSIEESLRHMASKADIQALQSEVNGVQDQVRAAAAGVKRIEDHLLARSQ